jgi:hypothetical protein
MTLRPLPLPLLPRAKHEMGVVGGMGLCGNGGVGERTGNEACVLASRLSVSVFLFRRHEWHHSRVRCRREQAHKSSEQQ